MQPSSGRGCFNYWIRGKKRCIARACEDVWRMGLAISDKSKQEARKMTDEISGFYKDDGTRIDPAMVPKPLLCETCGRDGLNEEEMILCILTRSDQEDEESFNCASYEAKLTK